MFDGTFEPIIFPTLFEAVQKVLASKARAPKRRHRHNFPFLGLFRCGDCCGMFTAQHTKGNGGVYRYYRCTKKHGACSQGYVQEKDLVAQIKDRLQTISLCDEYTDWMLAKIDEWEHEETNSSQSDVQNLSARIKADEERMEKLVSAYLNGDIPKEIYLTKKDATMRSLATLNEKKKDCERRGNTWIEPLREWVLDTKQATFLSSSDNFAEITSFVQKIGTNHTVRDKTARFSVPSPSHFVATRRPRLSSAAASRRRSARLNSDEVKFCAPSRNRSGVDYFHRHYVS